MNQDVYGAEGPVQRSSAPLIFGLCAGFGLVLLFVLYATGALDRVFGRGSAATANANQMQTATAQPVAPAPPAPVPAPGPAPVNTAAPAPAPAPAATPTPPPRGMRQGDAISEAYLAGRWCDYSGAQHTFDPNQHTMTFNNRSMAYRLSGHRLIMETGPSPYQVNADYSDDDNMIWNEADGTQRLMTRC